ncbi:SDR family oxidoreductase, partial [Spirochaetota bacterium]
GSGTGLGRSYALELAKRGASVVVNDYGSETDGTGSDTSMADSVVQEIIHSGGNAVANYESVTSLIGGKNIVHAAIENFGRLDILINNAGIIRDRSFAKMSKEEWNDVHSVHMKGAFNVTNAAWPFLRKNNYGRILMISSNAGLYGNFGQSNYGSAKTGMIGLMNCLNIEGAKYNILINTLSPTAATRLTENTMDPELFEKLKPDFIVPMVIYLVSEKNRESGNIINAAKNWYGKSAICCSNGITVGDGEKFPTPEDIMEQWDNITNLDGAKQLKSLAEFYKLVLGHGI